MTDLTKITTPFGLLDEATQTALREHNGPLEIFTPQGWSLCMESATLWQTHTYRVQPHPPKKEGE